MVCVAVRPVLAVGSLAVVRGHEPQLALLLVGVVRADAGVPGVVVEVVVVVGVEAAAGVVAAAAGRARVAGVVGRRAAAALVGAGGGAGVAAVAERAEAVVEPADDAAGGRGGAATVGGRRGFQEGDVGCKRRRRELCDAGWVSGRRDGDGRGRPSLRRVVMLGCG